MQNSLIDKAIKERGIGDAVVENCGPITIGDSSIWEIWVKGRDGKLATRFVQERTGAIVEIFDTFQSLAIELDKQHRSISDTLRAAEWEKTKEMLKLQGQQSAALTEQANARFTMFVTNAMTAGAFLIVLLVFAYMIVWTEYKGYAMLIFGAIAASACVFFYKNFTVAKLRGQSVVNQQPPVTGAVV
jgi:hypothetical protein